MSLTQDRDQIICACFAVSVLAKSTRCQHWGLSNSGGDNASAINDLGLHLTTRYTEHCATAGSMQEAWTITSVYRGVLRSSVSETESSYLLFEYISTGY